MPTYDLIISVTGRDKASSMFRQIEHSIFRIAETALGMVAARALEALTYSIWNMGVKALNAAAQIEMMQVNIESLVSRELALADGAASSASYLSAAVQPAKAIMDQLGRLAILSPYLLTTANNTFRMNMAFGFTSKQAMEMTEGLLNMGAGLGADNEQLSRMAYNLAQVRLQGKVTALDVRQLALAGLDLNAVLKYVGTTMGVEVNNIKDFNKAIVSGKITWEDFVKGFAEYSDNYFGGASERMARTLYGLSNTFKDVFNLTMPRILGPAVAQIATFLNKILDLFVFLYDSPILEEIGNKIGKAVGDWLHPFIMFFEHLGRNLDMGMGLLESFKLAADLAFGPGTGAKIDVLVGYLTSLWNLLVLIGTGDFKGPIFGALEGNAIVTWILDTRDDLFGFWEDLKTAFGNVKTFFETNGPAFSEMFGQIFDALDIEFGGGKSPIEWLGDTIVTLSGKLVTESPAIVANIQKFVDYVVQTAIPGIGNFVDKIRDEWIPAFQDMTGDTDWGALIASITGLVTILLTSGAAVGLVTSITNALNALAPILAGMDSTTLIALFANLGTVGPLLILLLPHLAKVIDGVETFKDAFDGIMEKIQPFIDAVGTTLGPTFAQLGEAFQEFSVAVMPFLELLLPLLGVILTVILAVLTGVIQGVTAFITLMLVGLTNIYQGIVTAWEGIKTYFQNWWLFITGLFTGNWEQMKAGFLGAFTAIWEIITGIAQMIWGVLVLAFANIIGLLGGFVEGVIEFFINLWNELVGNSIIPDMLQDIWDSFKEYFKFILDWLGKQVNSFLQLGTNIGNAFKDGLSSVVDKILAVFQTIKSVIEDIFDLGSPSKWAIGVGEQVAAGFEIGVGKINAGNLITRGVTGQLGNYGFGFDYGQAGNDKNITINITNNSGQPITDDQIIRAYNNAEAL